MKKSRHTEALTVPARIKAAKDRAAAWYAAAPLVTAGGD